MKSFIAFLPILALTSAMPIPSAIVDPTLTPRSSAFPQFTTRDTKGYAHVVLYKIDKSTITLDVPIGHAYNGIWDVTKVEVASVDGDVPVRCTLYKGKPNGAATGETTGQPIQNGGSQIFSPNRNRKRSQLLSGVECEKTDEVVAAQAHRSRSRRNRKY